VRPEHVSDGKVEEDFLDSDFLKKMELCWLKWLLCWRHEIQQNDTQQNGTQQNDTHQDDTQHYDIPNNNTQQNKIQHNDA
jgi:hypothetical protein